jgi:hypothetical protein
LSSSTSNSSTSNETKSENVNKPNEDSLTFNPPSPESETKDPAKKTQTMLKLEDKWKDVYSQIGDKELEAIIAAADKITDTYHFSDGVDRQYKPINNKLWKETTAQRREWQRIEAKENPSAEEQIKFETKRDEYYLRMCSVYFGMSKEEWENLPPAETIMAVEAANHKTQHPLKVSR